MATGRNLQEGRGNPVSNLPPTVSLRTGDAEMWDAAGRVADRLADAAKPDLIRRAQARGAAEGLEIAEGTREYKAPRFQFGDVAAARQAAVESAYDAKTRSDIDAREDELRRQFRRDPEGYEAAAAEMVSGFIQGAPPEFAVQVEGYARGRAARGLSAVADARTSADEQETVQALGVRAAKLSERMVALASQGKMDSDEYREAQEEHRALQDSRAGNPAVLYSEDQRLADDDKLDGDVLTANVSRLAVNAYSDAGSGMAGYAAATRFLRDEVLQGEAFKDLRPEARQRVYRDATTQLNQFSAVDREEKKVADEAERQAARDRRELVGDYRLRIQLGEVDRATIRADTTLDAGQKAGLLASVDAAERRTRAEERSLAAAERTAGTATYNEFRDGARAGTLDNVEIANAVQAGILSRGQAQTLRTLRDRTNRPIVDDVMQPVRDAAKRPGMSARGNREAMARAEENAAAWAVNNPDAPLDVRLSVGRNIAERFLGAGAAPGGQTTAANANTERAARVAAVNQRITAARTAGRPFSTAEANRMRNEAINGN